MENSNICGEWIIYEGAQIERMMICAPVNYQNFCLKRDDIGCGQCLQTLGALN